MKTIIGQAILAALLLAGGEGLRRAAHVEQLTVAAQETLATLMPATAATEYADIQGSIAAVERVPAIGTPVLSDLRRRRATALYWGADYAALTSVETNLEGIEDPAMKFLMANASFRSLQRAPRDRPSWVRELDALLESYALVLKNSPGHFDAAYNYELVVRLRNGIAKGQPPPAQPATAVVASDLPSGPTLHGRPGGPPLGISMENFKIIVPLLPTEREEQTNPGADWVKRRKG